MNKARDILKKLEGKEVYLSPTGNLARRSKEIEKTTLIKVAKVFATIPRYGDGAKYRISDRVINGIVSIESDCNSGYQVFESLKSYESYKELNKTKAVIQKFFSGYGDSLRDLDEPTIYKIAELIALGETK